MGCLCEKNINYIGSVCKVLFEVQCHVLYLYMCMYMYVQVMMGGEWFEELFGDPSTVSEDTILSTALEALQQQLGISQQPSHTIVSIEKVRAVL